MYSEAWQDEFANLMLGSPSTGYFLDIGAVTPPNGYGSNSLMFEENGWNGLLVDMDGDGLKSLNRKTPIFVANLGDGTNNTVSMGESLLHLPDVPKLIDYVSIDLEGQDYLVVKSIVDAGYEFKVLTIEHNLYSQNPGTKEQKYDTFIYLSSKGYIRVVDNAGNRASKGNLHEGWAFEDWYINPKYVNYQEAMKKIKEPA